VLRLRASTKPAFYLLVIGSRPADLRAAGQSITDFSRNRHRR